jgi:MFS family permease
MSMLLAAMGTSVANAALPTFVEVFAASFQQVQWIVLAYLLGITTLIVSVGRLGDIIGRSRLLVGGILLFTFASIGCGIAPTLSWLIAARAIQGLGAAVMMALSMALAAETVPKARIGRAMGLLGSMSAVGTALGPSLGGVLVAAMGWRTIFFVNMVVGPFYLARAFGLGAAGVGLVLSVGPFAAAASGLPAGRLADRFGTKRMTATGLAVTAAGCLLLCAIPGTLGLYGYIPAVVVVTAGYALFQAANSSAVMAGVESNRRGVVAGMLNLARNLGLITGASAMGALFAAASGSGDPAAASPEAVGQAMGVTFGVATALMVIALAIGSVGKGMRRRPAQALPPLPVAADRLCGSGR